MMNIIKPRCKCIFDVPLKCDIIACLTTHKKWQPIHYSYCVAVCTVNILLLCVILNDKPHITNINHDYFSYQSKMQIENIVIGRMNEHSVHTNFQ